MSSPREALIADLAQETGLPDGEIRQILNALIVRMNEEMRASGDFDMPGVGKLMRMPEIVIGTEYKDGVTVPGIRPVSRPRPPAGLRIDDLQIPVPEQSATGHPPAIAEVAEDAEVPRRGRDL